MCFIRLNSIKFTGIFLLVFSYLIYENALSRIALEFDQRQGKVEALLACRTSLRSIQRLCGGGFLSILLSSLLLFCAFSFQVDVRLWQNSAFHYIYWSQDLRHHYIIHQIYKLRNQFTRLYNQKSQHPHTS